MLHRPCNVLIKHIVTNSQHPMSHRPMLSDFDKMWCCIDAHNMRCCTNIRCCILAPNIRCCILASIILPTSGAESLHPFSDATCIYFEMQHLNISTHVFTLYRRSIQGLQSPGIIRYRRSAPSASGHIALHPLPHRQDCRHLMTPRGAVL